MENNRFTYVKNILLPCLLLSGITGIFTGGLIFCFKLASSAVISLSAKIYGFVRQDPQYLIWLVLGAALIGVLVWLVLRKEPHCRGGGIPTAVAILRGLITFHWVKSIFLLFGSAMMSFLVGVPLGNEGPSVQMGTAIGRGTVRVFAKKNPAWDRYIMTGGACAGFAVATGAPLSGIFFAFEEAHRRFSPMIFMVAASAAITGSATMRCLCDITGNDYRLFDFTVGVDLPLKYIYAALIVGFVCGICAVGFTKVYRLIRTLVKKKLSRLPFLCKTVFIFVAVALIGYFAEECIGSGHSLVDELIEGHGVWYLLIIYLLVRAVLLILANHIGVTGGLFVPTLAFGAIVGTLCAQGMIALGILPQQYYIVMVIIGMASFLGASSRTPITAIAFAIEALCGISNILPIALGVTFAYLVIETFGIPAFSETVIESKLEEENAGKTPQVIDTRLTVRPGSFVVGKEIRDILWPPSCVIMSVQKAPSQTGGEPGISEFDVLHVHYQTYDPDKTAETLEALVGKQDESIGRKKTHLVDKNHQVPEI